jgi:hypothetical protein
MNQLESSSRKKKNWGKIFSDYIKALRKTPKYEKYTYNCLMTMPEVLEDFQLKKEKYLEREKEKKMHHRNTTTTGGKRRRIRLKRTKRKTRTRTRTRNGGYSQWYSQLMGYNPPPNAVAYEQPNLQT